MPTRDIMKISFEFSPKLGVRELPRISTDHESNVKGMYVVGDLADAPIIKVALNQGFDVARSLAEGLVPSRDEGVFDVVVVGAGPAGIGAALASPSTRTGAPVCGAAFSALCAPGCRSSPAASAA